MELQNVNPSGENVVTCDKGHFFYRKIVENDLKHKHRLLCSLQDAIIAHKTKLFIFFHLTSQYWMHQSSPYRYGYIIYEKRI
jgi:hypothetical protein